MGMTHFPQTRLMASPQGVWVKLALLLFVCFGLILTLGCSPSSDKPAGRPTVMVSIFPLADLIEPMTQGWADVITLLPPGMSVHAYEPSIDQYRAAAQADVLIVVGRNLDGWAERVVKQAAGPRDVPVVTFAQMLDGPAGRNQVSHGHHHGHDHGHDHGHHHHDPAAPNAHLWLDPVLVRQFIAELAPQLAKLAPDAEAAARCTEAAKAIQRRLDDLDTLHRQQLASVKRREMVTFHNAFDLLAQRYGLHVVAHLTDVDVAPGGDVTPDQLKEVIQAIRQHDLKVVYAEPQFPDRAVEVIRQETGTRILRLDDLGGSAIPGYGSYFDMMTSNLQTIAQGQAIE